MVLVQEDVGRAAAMNQRDASFLYRGILLFLAGGCFVTLLSSIDQPWARHASAIAAVVVFVGFAAFIAFTTFRSFFQFLDAPISDEPLSPDLSMDRWIVIARFAVAATALLAIAFVAVVLFAEPPKQCADWHLPDAHSTPIWLPFLMTVPLLVGLTFVVIFWPWVLRKAIASVDYPTSVPIPYTLVATVFAGCAFSQFPWFLLITKCWPGS